MEDDAKKCPDCGEELAHKLRCVSCGWHPERTEKLEGDETNRDLMALYERGEISAETLAEGTKGEGDPTAGLVRFKGEGDDVYLTMNVLSAEEGKVTFRIGIQWAFGIEFLGFRKFTSTDGRRTRHGTNCKLRAMNGVTLVSMCGPPEWCPDGWYYSLARAEHLGRDEDELSDGVFLVQEEEASKEVMAAEMAAEMRKFYARMSGSRTYDEKQHNQVIRGRVLKVMGPDEKNGELTVTSDEFESIEFAVRAYNKYMNDNAAPEEFNRHVAKMMRTDRLLGPLPESEPGRIPLEELSEEQKAQWLEDRLEAAEQGEY